jgi:3-hydroxyacyl-[acyl-carrier-protein] dehydratase
MRFLMIDRILEWEAGSWIKGTKSVAMSEDFLEYHFPGNPVMPGVLLLEAAIQLAGWLEAAGSDFSHWFLPTRVRKCSFYGFVLPGDRVEFEVRAASKAEPGVRAYQCVGMVEGKRKVKAEFEGERVPLGELEDSAEQRKLFQILSGKAGFHHG